MTRKGKAREGIISMSFELLPRNSRSLSEDLLLFGKLYLDSCYDYEVFTNWPSRQAKWLWRPGINLFRNFRFNRQLQPERQCE